MTFEECWSLARLWCMLRHRTLTHILSHTRCWLESFGKHYRAIQQMLCLSYPCVWCCGKATLIVHMANSNHAQLNAIDEANSQH